MRHESRMQSHSPALHWAWEQDGAAVKAIVVGPIGGREKKPGAGGIWRKVGHGSKGQGLLFFLWEE